MALGKNARIAIPLLIAALVAIWFFFFRLDRAPLSQREIATRVLAEYLRDKLHPKSVLVVSNPFYLHKGGAAQIYAFQEASVKGLRKGFGPGVGLKLAYPKIKPEALQDRSSVYVDPETTTPVSFYITDDAFDELLRQNVGAEVVISLIGLPLNIRQLEAWKNDGPPRFALLLPDWRMVGDAAAVRQAFKSGKIAAAVVFKRGGSPDAKVESKDYKTEFDKQFVLLTAENVDSQLGR